MSSMVPRPVVRVLLPVLVTTSLLVTSGAAALTVDFPYRDAELLLPAQELGGRLWVPDDFVPKKTYQLIVLLHGLNQKGTLHPLLDPEGVDLAPVAAGLIAAQVVRPDFVIAAPTQSKDALKARTLWTRFDLFHFLRAVRKAAPKGLKIGAKPVVAGHSGAGCDENGGLWYLARAHGGTLPAFVVMDTCASVEFGQTLWRHLWPRADDPEAVGRRGKSWLLHFWQPRWVRDIAGFEETMRFELMMVDGPRGTHLLKRNDRRWLSAQVDGTHSEMVAQIFEEALRRLYPTPPTLAELQAELAAAQAEKKRLLQEERRRRREEARRATRTAPARSPGGGPGGTGPRTGGPSGARSSPAP